MESSIKLFPHQEKALTKLKSGSILVGGVGSGKSFTSLFFYLKNYSNIPVCIITTAKKRNDGDWQRDCELLGIENYVVDSWNNIKKYTGAIGFFIFDEQKVRGSGTWSKSFIKISKKNPWIMLSATPGDNWLSYIPVFIANGWYKNRTEFINRHVEYNQFVSFPQVKRYHDTGHLQMLRNRILVDMPFDRHTVRHRIDIKAKFDEELYSMVNTDRWNPFTDKPIRNASEFTQVCRRIVNTSENRIFKARWMIDAHDRIIIFYNYNYELDLLIEMCTELGRTIFQYNSKIHDPVPEEDEWVYIVQYTAASEGWNCITTDVILFYSLNYAWWMMEQSEGRIDRLNTPYTDLYYLYFSSGSEIDESVNKAIKQKKEFNESAWTKKKGLDFRHVDGEGFQEEVQRAIAEDISGRNHYSLRPK